MNLMNLVERILSWLDEHIAARWHHVTQVTSLFLLCWAVHHGSSDGTVATLAGLAGGVTLGAGAISAWKGKSS